LKAKEKYIEDEERPFLRAVQQSHYELRIILSFYHPIILSFMKKTVIIGATPNSQRYAYIAAEMLTDYGHEIVPVGIKKGAVFGKPILDLREKPQIDDVHTITLYIGPQHQPEWYDYILQLQPKRIIFNPGTENQELMQKAKEAGIEPVIGCTLVMLRSSSF
jgi:uncharacterized protein